MQTKTVEAILNMKQNLIIVWISARQLLSLEFLLCDTVYVIWAQEQENLQNQACLAATQSEQSLLGTLWAIVAKESLLHTDSEVSGHTARMHKLNKAFSVSTCDLI